MSNTPSYYAIIPSEVRYADIPPSSKLLFGEITALSNKEGFCFASNSYFAKLYDVEERQIQRWIKVLTSHNFISIKLEQNNTRSIFIGASKKTPPPVKKDTPLLIYNNTSNNNILYKEKVKKESSKFEDLEVGMGDEFIAIWREFVEFRAEMKHALTKTSAKTIMNKLKQYSKSEAVQMLHNSIENGWRGVFPLLQKKGKANSVKVSNFDGQESGFSDGNF